jgi:hypothetical protein
MFRFLMTACLALALIQSAHAAEPAGVVTHLQGSAVSSRPGSSENLSKGAAVLAGDRIVTGRHARLVLHMSDGAVVTLGEDTEFVIGRYHYSENEKTGSALLELVKGVFRATTGAIGKLPARDFKVKTAVATIGIRGTDFWGGFYFSQALDVALLGGAGIYVENAGGRVEVSNIGEGTTIGSADSAPSMPKRWGDQKLSAAKQSVAVEDDAQP